MRNKGQINITEELKEKCNASDQFERLDRLFRVIVSVPKSSIDNEEAKWKLARAKKKWAKKV